MVVTKPLFFLTARHTTEEFDTTVPFETQPFIQQKRLCAGYKQLNTDHTSYSLDISDINILILKVKLITHNKRRWALNKETERNLEIVNFSSFVTFQWFSSLYHKAHFSSSFMCLAVVIFPSLLEAFLVISSSGKVLWKSCSTPLAGSTFNNELHSTQLSSDEAFQFPL